MTHAQPIQLPTRQNLFFSFPCPFHVFVRYVDFFLSRNLSGNVDAAERKVIRKLVQFLEYFLFFFCYSLLFILRDDKINFSLVSLALALKINIFNDIYLLI